MRHIRQARPWSDQRTHMLCVVVGLVGLPSTKVTGTLVKDGGDIQDLEALLSRSRAT